MRAAALLLCFVATTMPTVSHAWPWDPETPKQVQAPPAPPAPPVGRYQIVINSSMGRQTFLLDTTTGNVWQLTQYTDLEGEPLAWGDMSVLSTFADYQNFIKTHKPKTVVPKQ